MSRQPFLSCYFVTSVYVRARDYVNERKSGCITQSFNIDFGYAELGHISIKALAFDFFIN